MSTDKLEIYDHIVRLIENNTIKLPSVPDVIMHIEKALDDDNSSMGDIAKIIQNEITLCSRILQVSNSPALRGHTKIISIKDALSRIGLTMVKNLIMTITLRDKFKSDHEELNAFLYEIFEFGVDLSYTAYQVAKRNKKLGFNADLTHLAGIIFGLGKLPVISYYEDHPYENIEEVKAQADKYRVDLNKVILSKWEINIDIAAAVFRYRIQPTSIDTGDLLLIVEAFLKKDDSILKSGNRQVREIWNDLEANRDIDKVGADEIKHSLIA